MFPRIASFICGTIGYIIVSSAALMYVSRLMRQPFGNVFTVGLSAFALLAAMCGLCFSFAPCLSEDKDRKTALYAGEKFLHSCILILQTIFLIYVKEGLLAIKWVGEHNWLRSSISVIMHIILIITSSLATWFCLFAVEAINDFLWERYEIRWKDLRWKKGK
jgi:hypothetical protein